MREIIFGAGLMGRKYCSELGEDTQILAFADNNPEKWGKQVFDYPVIDPSLIPKENYDRIVIAMNDLTLDGCNAITEILGQLSEMNVPMSKIFLSDCRHSLSHPRVDFLRKSADILNNCHVEGAVAECGVYRGHFAGYINKYFPERKLYLFDTFEGFDNRDKESEGNPEVTALYDNLYDPWLSRGNADVAILRCPYREKVILKKGYIPETFSGVEQERFAFVNIDMDLYLPMLAALRFFSRRLNRGGIILLHDYYHRSLSGVKQAVDEFAYECSFTRLPIGDNSSIAIIPNA